MQLPWDEHFFEIVVPAWQAYRAAEQRLSRTSSDDDAGQMNRARYDVLREGGAAAFYVHHFAEIVVRAQPPWLPSEAANLADARAWLSQRCTMLRTDNPVADVSLLGDVADALKHAILTRHADRREVSSNDAVLVVASGFGELNFGEGKFSGEQAIILAKSGKRALSSILQNVIDAWRRAAQINLPPIGAP
jgi:hypothetical protein